MILTLIISASAFLLFILSVFFFPQVTLFGKKLNTFWIFPLIGAILLVVFSKVTPSEIWASFTQKSAINPLKILILFFSMTLISIFLDEAGFFEFLASKTAQKAGDNQLKLFISLYVIISILTIFTSNDIVILTFTPFICYFCKNAKINPIPYLIMEFVAGNTWSLLLIIGNPTNIYVATALSANFLDYTMTMLLPTVVAGLSSFGIMWLLFRKSLREPLTTEKTQVKINDKFLTFTALFTLAFCIVMLAIVSFVPFVEMYLVSLFCALALIVTVLIYRLAKKQKPSLLIKTIGRAPFSLVPFLLSMFIIVLALTKYGVTQNIADFLGDKNSVFVYGVTSFFFANVLNNIPMSVLFSNVATLSQVTLSASYAVILSSNIGAILTPVGALAGIMWSNIIAKNSIPMSVKTFVKYGIIIAVPTLILSLCALTFSF